MADDDVPQELVDAAYKYLADHPFTLAGFSRPEVELIQSAYRKAFVAGAKWNEERRWREAFQSMKPKRLE